MTHGHISVAKAWTTLLKVQFLPSVTKVLSCTDSNAGSAASGKGVNSTEEGSASPGQGMDYTAEGAVSPQASTLSDQGSA